MFENDSKYSNFVRKQIEMGKKLKGIDESKLKDNPFTETLVVEVTKREDTSKLMITEDGEEVPSYYYVEKTKSTRIKNTRLKITPPLIRKILEALFPRRRKPSYKKCRNLLRTVLSRSSILSTTKGV